MLTTSRSCSPRGPCGGPAVAPPKQPSLSLILRPARIPSASSLGARGPSPSAKPEARRSVRRWCARVRCMQCCCRRWPCRPLRCPRQVTATMWQRAQCLQRSSTFRALPRRISLRTQRRRRSSLRSEPLPPPARREPLPLPRLPTCYPADSRAARASSLHRRCPCRGTATAYSSCCSAGSRIRTAPRAPLELRSPSPPATPTTPC
mmetsp:Transcript_23319/g.57775  ORF Transcript_23319/g.57775 Transcript_23319/m.57775 type:complete len:205 (-) Transcript_23319:142-756(-)